MEKNICKISRWQILKSQLNNLDSNTFLALLKDNDDAILLDVRTKKEFDAEHLPNAINMDFLGPNFWEAYEKLDPSKIYLVYCRSGRRSSRVCLWMKNSGFDKVYNLDKGIQGMAGGR